jgi:hypothetical protein
MNLNETAEVGDRPEGSSALLRAAFFAGPVVLVVARLLLEPLGDADWDRTLTDVASHRGRSDAGWLLAILGCGLMSLGSGGYVRLIGRRRRHVGATVLSLLVPLGWVACGAICVAGLAMSASAVRPERPTMIAWQESMNSSTSVAVLFAVTMLAGLGYLWLAVEFVRGRVVGTSAAVLIGLGGMSTLVTMPGPVKPVLVAASALLAVGHWLALRPFVSPSPAAPAGLAARRPWSA